MWGPHKALLLWTCGTSNPPSGWPWDWHAIHTSLVRVSCPDSVVSVSNKSFDRVSQAIIIHCTKSMLDRIILCYFRRPATTCPTLPIERKDKDDDKSSLQQSLTTACRIMMVLPPFKQYHDNQKVFPSFWGTRLLAR